MRDTDRRIARVAAEHLSLITSRQLLDIGVTRDERDSRVERRLLVPVHPGVYRMPWVPPSYKRDVLAGCLPGHRRGWVLLVSRAGPVLVRAPGRLRRRPGPGRLEKLLG